jgi:ribosomal protein S2
MFDYLKPLLAHKFNVVANALPKEAFYVVLDVKSKLRRKSQIHSSRFIGTYKTQYELFPKKAALEMFEKLQHLFTYVHLNRGQMFVASSEHLFYNLTNAISAEANMPYFIHPQWVSGNITNGWQDHPISAQMASLVFVPDLVRDLRVWKEARKVHLPVIGNISSNSQVVPTYPLLASNFAKYTTVFFF